MLWRVAAGLVPECIVMVHLFLWDLSCALTLDSNLNYYFVVIHATTQNCLPWTKRLVLLYLLLVY